MCLFKETEQWTNLSEETLQWSVMSTYKPVTKSTSVSKTRCDSEAVLVTDLTVYPSAEKSARLEPLCLKAHYSGVFTVKTSTERTGQLKGAWHSTFLTEDTWHLKKGDSKTESKKHNNKHNCRKKVEVTMCVHEDTSDTVFNVEISP